MTVHRGAIGKDGKNVLPRVAMMDYVLDSAYVAVALLAMAGATQFKNIPTVRYQLIQSMQRCRSKSATGYSVRSDRKLPNGQSGQFVQKVVTVAKESVQNENVSRQKIKIKKFQKKRKNQFQESNDKSTFSPLSTHYHRRNCCRLR